MVIKFWSIFRFDFVALVNMVVVHVTGIIGEI